MLPQKILDFRLSETASGAFSGALIVGSYLQGGARFDQGGTCPPPPNEPLITTVINSCQYKMS